MFTRGWLCLLLTAAPLTHFASELRLAKAADTTLDPKALCFTNGPWGRIVNGESFQQNAIFTFNGFQYGTFYDAARRLCVSRRKSGQPRWETLRFEDYHFQAKNDSHNVAVLGICAADGTIHLAFDHHASPLHYRVSRPGLASRPADFAWEPALFGKVTDELWPSNKLRRVTYPRFISTPGGGLQFGCRIGGSGDGDKCLADYDPKRSIWENFGVFLGGQGDYHGMNSRNAYLNGLTYDRQGRLHVTWCWRETGDPQTNHDLNYAWSDDEGNTWLANDGKTIARRGLSPITIETTGCRIVELGMNRGLLNAMTQAVDRRGQIHFITLHLPDGAPTERNWRSSRAKSRFHHYWRDSEGHWRCQRLPWTGSRPQLWFDSADNGWLVFADGQLRIAGATAASNWSDWKTIHTETGPFTAQPQIDRSAENHCLSVYIQEDPSSPESESSCLRVIDFQAGDTR